MKKSRIRLILILSLIFIAGTLIVSFLLESRSQKLPAVVNSNKVLISSNVNGILKKLHVASMQKVDEHMLIAEIENSKLPLILDNLKNEKRKYDELISSTKSGAYLKSELYELDGDIQENQIELEEAKLEISKVGEKLKVFNERYASSISKYETNKKLFDIGILNNSDFEKASRDFWDVYDTYQELKADSLVAYETVKARQNILLLLKARKEILSNNVDVLGSKYLIDINKVEADLNDMQEDVRNLNIYSPIEGIITDINFLPGETINEGDVIAEVSDLKNIWIIAYGNSSSSHKVSIGQKVRIYCEGNKKIWGKVVTVSPVMEKVKSLSTTFETVNTYTKVEIKFDDIAEALKYITPGERLFVRINFKSRK